MERELQLNIQTIDEEAGWQAVASRDASFDGQFVYAVRSTGIYCKPSCSSRRPRRDQVRFFATCAAAEQAGFRACRRCHPREVLSANQVAELAQRACRLIDEHIEDPLTLEALGQALNTSPSHLHRIFKSVTGLTPRQYAAGQRLQRFKSHVKSGQEVTSALYEAGYGSSSRLYESGHERLGMTPAAYQRGGKGARIGYTVVDTPLGRMLVAATDRGICRVSLGERDEELERQLQAEFPAAEIRRDPAGLEGWVNALVEHLHGQHPDLALPLDLQATAFQLRVWEELRKIPYGQTRTYAQVAEAIGQPSAARAVANACGANPAILITPCHRVVRSDGSLGGYHYGVERKQKLLEQEKRQSTSS
jgi:AraC family transcriptional regulator, regulatory protein of adaptative response / methylated-DNA-[protein]-cysteine methyltransferase